MSTKTKKRRGPAGVSPETTQGIYARLITMRDRLSPTYRRIADFIIEHTEEIIYMSVTEVAKAADASEGSVVGLCRLVGTKGFQDLKISLARQLVEPVQFIHEDLQRDDSIPTVIEKIFNSNIQALTDTRSILSADAMERAVNIILEAERVEFYGIGSSAPIAIDAYYRMLRIGIRCSVAVDSHIQAVSASLTNSNVAVITISHSGSTIETVEATRLAKEAGAKTICITNYGKSPIQNYADVVLHTAARETRFRTEAMASRLAELCIVDMLTACIALATYERSL